MRIQNVDQATTALTQSVASFVVGVIGFFMGCNLIGMAFVHTGYILKEKTTNESVQLIFQFNLKHNLNEIVFKTCLAYIHNF